VSLSIVLWVETVCDVTFAFYALHDVKHLLCAFTGVAWQYKLLLLLSALPKSASGLFLCSLMMREAKVTDMVVCEMCVSDRGAQT
jgi:hypothetical protein